MMNQTILVGRLVRDVELEKTENENSVAIMTLAVPRSFKNMDGEYETDFIPCILWKGVAENTAEYCRKGDIIGVKGRLQTRTVEKEDGTKENKIELVTEKVTFLSSRKSEE